MRFERKIYDKITRKIDGNFIFKKIEARKNITTSRRNLMGVKEGIKSVICLTYLCS